jgi:hypothetical protein
MCWPLASCRKTDESSRRVPVDESRVQEIDWFHAKAWDDVPDFVRILLRYVDDSCEDFVIVPGFAKPADEVPVEVAYRYIAREERFERVARQAWDHAIGPVWEVRRQFKLTRGTNVGFPRVSGAYGTLRVGGTKVETAGWAVLTVVVSPDGELVAANSANGEKRWSLYATLPPKGPFYLEIFKIAGKRRVGPIYRFKRYGGGVSLWWTPDGRYVVSGRTHILVLPVFKMIGRD